ncbi:hypothetical protein ACWD4T_52545 [Streptomyces umbrinus]
MGGLGRHGEPSGCGAFDDGAVQVAVVEGDLVAAAAQAPGQQVGRDTGAVPAPGAADRDVQRVLSGARAAGVGLGLGNGGGEQLLDAGACASQPG